MVKISLCIILFLATSLYTNAQNNGDSIKTVKAVAPKFYPSAAVAVRAKGEVKIRVEINEKGKVKFAKILSGHKLLQRISEKAASLWEFNPWMKNENERFVELSFIYQIVSEDKDEETSFNPPYQIVFAVNPPKIINTPSH